MSKDKQRENELLAEIEKRTASEEQLRRHNEYLTSLHETSLGLMNRLNLDELLEDISPLLPHELKEMHRHCEIGYRIALSAPELAPISGWILKHHEWWDGNGYPLGLKGEEIPLECRILAIIDAYDAMISNRPYRKAISSEAALAELQRYAGSQFDPRLVEIFISVMQDMANNI